MPHRRPPLSQEDTGKLIALGAVLMGAFLYLYPPWQAGFPINDGGLFYTMIRAIQQGGFRLPTYVDYNGLSIPFAYPPFALYLGAALSSALQLDPITILRWLPACVLIAISVAFYFLAAELLDSPIEGGIATFLYVCTPRSMTWLVMGGGLTRSFGQLFMLLTVLFVFSLYTRRERKHIYLAIMAGSLVVLSHPEAALHAVAGCMLCWIIKGRTRRTIRDSLWVGLGIAVVTALWWVPVLIRHGLAPYLSASQTGWRLSASLISPLLMTFTEEPGMTVVPVLGLVGLAVCLSRHEYYLPIWLVLPFLVDPRNSPTIAIVPLALMGALALHKVVVPGLARIAAGVRAESTLLGYHASAVRLLLAFLGVYLIIMAFYAGMVLAETRISPQHRHAFAWVAKNTPPASRFLIMTGNTDLFRDPLQDWFPALTTRASATTIQGHEWDSNVNFFERAAGLEDLQRCEYMSAPAACLREAAATSGLQFDHIYVPLIEGSPGGGRKGEVASPGEHLITDLLASGEYVRVNSTSAVVILMKTR